ncbi:vascular endothelial growth factor receptor 1-like [Tachysurus ichikawai]
MITLFVALCLLTSVKPSNIKELQVKKVKIGEDVTIKCGVSSDNAIVWFKQSFGKVPQLVGRTMGNGFRHNDKRFSVSDEKLFNLNITNVKEEDTGTYFCVEMLNISPDFTSGTLLVVEDEEIKRIPPAVTVLENGESLTLQCSVQTITSSCGKPSVYWFRHGSGESHPGIIYTHGNASDECKKSSEAGSPPQSCVYTLPKRKLTTSDKETLYCAVAECGQILFGNGIIASEKRLSFGTMVGHQKCDLSRPRVLLELGCQVNQEAYWWTWESSRLNRHLIVVEGFACLNDPRSYVVSQGKQVLGDGPDKDRFKTPYEKNKNEVCDVARYGATGAPPWSQARCWGSHASAWWPGLTPKGPAGLSPKERRGADLPWAHHLQEEP